MGWQLRQYFQMLYHIATCEPGETCSGCGRLFIYFIGIRPYTIVVGRPRHMERPDQVGPIVERWHEDCFDKELAPKGYRVGPVPAGSWKENNVEPVRLDQLSPAAQERLLQWQRHFGVR